MFKSYRNPYYSRRKRRFTGLWKIFFLIVGGIILLEVLTWAVLKFSGDSANSAINSQKPEIVYQLQFLDRQGNPFIGLPDQGSLLAQETWSQGYQLVPNQENQYWQINEQGFREEQNIPVAKPQGEFRIVILGGSTAFGKGTKSNAETLAALLETRLQERLDQQTRSPEKYRPEILPITGIEREKALNLPSKIKEGKYQVINAAVPGYSSKNILAQFALKILSYNPDAIVVLGGYEDLMLEQSQEMTTIPRIDTFLDQPSTYFWVYLKQPVQNFITNTHLFKALNSFVFKPQVSLTQKTLVTTTDNKPLADYLPQSAEAIESRLERYRNNTKQLIQLCAGAKVPLIVALQPEITGISAEKRQPQEKEIIQELGNVYTQKVKQSFTRLGEINDQLGEAFPQNVRVLDYYALYDNLSALAFQDPIHLTQEGNKALAERLYSALTSLPELQVVSQTPRR